MIGAGGVDQPCAALATLLRRRSRARTGRGAAMAGRLLFHTVWFAFLCRRAFSGVAGDSWTVSPREGAPHACGECAQHKKPRERDLCVAGIGRLSHRAADAVHSAVVIVVAVYGVLSVFICGRPSSAAHENLPLLGSLR